MIDIDSYRVHTPSQAGPVSLTVSVRAAAVNGIVPSFDILNSAGQIVSTTILYNGAERATVQAIGLSPNTDYYVRVRGKSAIQLGNYELTAFAGATAIVPHTMVQGLLIAKPEITSLVVVQNAVFHFLLTVNGSATQAVRMMIDGVHGRVYDLTVYGGSTANNPPIFLAAGQYTVTFQLVGTATIDGGAIAFTLASAILSDPITPGVQDTTQSPAGPNAGANSYYIQKLQLVRKWMRDLPVQPLTP